MNRLQCALIVLLLIPILLFGFETVTLSPILSQDVVSPQLGQFNSLESRDAVAPSNVTIHTANGNIVLSWTTVTGALSYIVEASDLIATGYTDVSASGSFSTVGSTVSWTKVIANPHHFYRVKSVSNSMPADFALVTGGMFYVGIYPITISTFYICKYEVTQASYIAVMGSNPSLHTGDLSYPVDNISWFTTLEYCNRRSIQEGLNPVYAYLGNTNPANWPYGWNLDPLNWWNVSTNWSANGYRLPTEMEWMFAARGGNQPTHFTYSGSNTCGDVAWYSVNSGYASHGVGLKQANELGIFDMSGNMLEWCWDLWGEYATGAQTNPHGPASNYDTYRTLRGGDFNIGATYCTVAWRDSNFPTTHGSVWGFRVVRNAP